MNRLNEILAGIEAGRFGARGGWDASAALENKALDIAKRQRLAVWSDEHGRVVLTPAGRKRALAERQRLRWGT